MTLTSVVLPAPFGPIKPWIVPCSTSSDTSSTACTTPKWRRTSTRRSSTDSGSRPPRWPHERKAAAADDALRSENDDEDQKRAREDVDVVAGVREDVRQQSDDQRADHGSQHEPAPTEDGEGQNLHCARDPVLRIARVDEEVEVRLERARIAGDHRAQHERDQLVARNVDALAQGRELVLADRGPRVAEAALGQAPHQEDDHDQRREDDRHAAERIGGAGPPARAPPRDRPRQEHAPAAPPPETPQRGGGGR